ncbi:helix-turn-helix domain-containing protein [Filimonas effusa]|uniref:Helix-turn-helix domain-containing protein n=1 Tax=Filimonas effusa TaxID=2508721 RepID=A0A4Q1D474_9BACT|nr:helix-turn-helix domain-containing protein [Filimonas effusa]RXK81947.1 helix-turn-helix domain-containing protein [Filimonas effusa]
MRKKASIPVKPLGGEFRTGIVIGNVVSGDVAMLDEADHSHRHDYHIFVFIKAGSGVMEIDFRKYKLKGPVMLYMHPSQVHRLLNTSGLEAFMLGVKDDNIYAHYFQLLEQKITPAKPLWLKPDKVVTFNQAASLCNSVFEKKSDNLYLPLLRDCSNAFIGLFVSLYLERQEAAEPSSRFSTITSGFKLLLENSFSTMKRPSEYAEALHVSSSYLNECVRAATGYPVSYHIHQRVVLEAKRLLYHSGKTVKEIAADLGYEDYAYFSRLFTKTAGMSALAFRNKNRDLSNKHI